MANKTSSMSLDILSRCATVLNIRWCCVDGTWMSFVIEMALSRKTCQSLKRITGSRCKAFKTVAEIFGAEFRNSSPALGVSPKEESSDKWWLSLPELWQMPGVPHSSYPTFYIRWKFTFHYRSWTPGRLQIITISLAKEHWLQCI